MRRKAKLIVRMRRDEDEDEELPAEDDNPLREFQDERSAAEESLDEDANDKWLVDDDGNSIDSNDSYYKEYDDESNISDANSELSSEDPSNIKKGEENDAEQRIIANLTSSAIEKSQRKVLKKEQGAAKKRKKNPKSHSNVTKLLNSCGNVADDDNNNNNNISKHCSRSDIVKSGDQSSFIQDMFEELDLPADKQNVSDTSPCSNQNFGIKTDPEADEFLAAFNKKVSKEHVSPDTVENLSLFPEKLGNSPVPKLNQKIESFIATVSEDDEKTRPNSNCPPGNAQGLSRSVTLEDHVSPREDIETPSKSNLATTFVDSDFYITDVIDYYYELNNTIYLFGMLLDQNKRALQKCCIRCNGFMKSVLIRSRPEFTGTNNDLLQEFGRLFIKSDCIQMLKHEETKKSIVFTDFSQNEKILEIYYKPSFLKVPILNKVNSDKILEIFGASDTTIEQFLIRTKLRLPQWIVIQNMTVSDDRTSWCNVELMMDYCYESSLNIQISTDDCEIGDKKLEIRFSAITLSLIKYYNSESNTVHIIGFSLLSCQDFNPAEDYEESNFKYRVISISPLPDGTKLPYDWNLYIKSKGLKNFNSENLPNERAVLGSMLAKIQSIDPDIIFGYDILDGDAKLLLSRLKSLKVPFFSKLGRLRISNYQSVSNRQSKYVAPHLKIFAGRLIADVLIFAKELTNIISYSLVELFKSLNPDNKEQNDYSPDINTAIIDNITKDCFEDSSKLHEVICLAFMRNIHILKISENLLFFPLVCKLSSICGMTLSKVLQGGRAIRCEFLLLHAFYNQSIIPPEISRIPARNDDLKEDSNEEHTSNKAKYSGGIVLEPEIGFYPNYISVLDFNSLYPSLMMEYNICFTTLLPLLHSKGLIDSNDETEWIEVCKNEMVQALTNSNSTKMALLPSEIKNLVDKRREIKRKISQKSVPSANNNSRDLTELKHLNIEQQALKLTANSIYGCLGFKNSRFFAQKLAQMITKTGRDALLTAKAQSEKIGYNVIYGDTDSIMINIKDKHTSLEVVQSISQRICNVINGKFRILRIGVDHLYKNMLLIRKKKYAALAVSSPEKNGNSLSFSKEMKGLDIVRRDWSKIAKEVGNKVLDEILAAALGMEENIISILQQYSKKIRTDTIPLDSYQIFRQLNKNPDDYPQSNQLPHVAVAKRMNLLNPSQFTHGCVVPFIMCIKVDDENSTKEAAYHISEVVGSSQHRLVPSVQYYLNSQIKPVVERLCAPLNKISISGISAALGLEKDSRNFNRNLPSTVAHDRQSADNAFNTIGMKESPLINHNQYSIPTTCQFCNNQVILLPDCGTEKTCDNFNTECSHCSKCLIDDSYGQSLHSQAVLDHIQQLIGKFYSPALVCSNFEEECDHYERLACILEPKRINSNNKQCIQCSKVGSLGPKISNASLHAQIVFISTLVRRLDTKYEYFITNTLTKCSSILNNSQYYRIDMKEAFSFLRV